MKNPTSLLLTIAIGIASAFADEPLTFKTRDGHEYKNVEISKILPNGIQVMTNDGIELVPGEQLPEDLQKRFNIDPQKAAEAEKKAASAAATYFRRSEAQSNAIAARKDVAEKVKKLREEIEKLKRRADVEPLTFHETWTSAEIWIYVPTDNGGEVKSSMQSVYLDGRMPDSVQAGDHVEMFLYPIGNTGGTERTPCFTPSIDRAVQYYAAALMK